MTKKDNFILFLFYLKEEKKKMKKLKKNTKSISIKLKKLNNTISCSKNFIFTIIKQDNPKPVKNFLKISLKSTKVLPAIFKATKRLLWCSQSQMTFYFINASLKTESSILKKSSMKQRKMLLNIIFKKGRKNSLKFLNILKVRKMT